MANNEVQLALVVEAEKALKNLKAFHKEASSVTKSAETGFGNLTKAAAAVGGAFAAYFAAKNIIGFFSAGIDGAQKQEDAMRRLQTAMEQSGEFTDEAAKKFNDFAGEMEKTTRFGDDVVLSQLAMAKSFGLSNDQAQELVKTAADLATRTGDTLDGAVEKLGKTYTGTAGALGKTIPAMKGLTQEQLKNGEAVRMLGKMYAGAAQDDIKTFSGAVLQAQNAFANVGEAFGTIIIENPAVIAAIGQLTRLFNSLEASVMDNRSMFDSFINGAIRGLVVGFSMAVDAVGFVIKAFQGLIGVVNLAIRGVSFIVKGWGELIGLIPGMEGVADALKRFDEAVAADNADTTKKFQAFNAEFAKLQGAVDESAAKIFAADRGIAKSGKDAAAARNNAAKQIIQDAEKFKKLTEEAAKFEREITKASLDEIGKVMQKRDEQLEQIRRFEAEGVYHARQAEEQRVKVILNAQKEVDEIRAKSRAEQL